ncbi:Exosome complex component CSL4 [Symbiodinium microadriaticum]|uniref:Exosome complex component CSL4 n=1 Tax=Symbiodinium microadriaticum TaxID=2951 RepID=A0A1Q9DN31_SYMMI|nr:Exosome complex component CSL4 [Symbiodinium microadriaticum]
MADEDVAMQAVAPGEPIGSAEDLLAGRGTYTDRGKVFASLAGQLRYLEGSTVEVLSSQSLLSFPVPEVGATVVARVVRLSQDRAECIIVAVGETPLQEKFRGVVRKQDVRFFEASS